MGQLPARLNVNVTVQGRKFPDVHLYHPSLLSSTNASTFEQISRLHPMPINSKQALALIPG